MAQEALGGRQFAPTSPEDLLDPARFSQIYETVADAFVLEIREFFNRTQPTGRLAELPTIDKYAIDWGLGQDPLATAVSIFQDYPDVLENLPHVAVTSISIQNRPLTFGTPWVDQVQYPPRVVGSVAGPYNLTDGWILRYRTTPPKRNGDLVESAVLIRTSSFASLAAATAADVVRVINNQALHAQARVSPTGTVEIQTGGPVGQGTPNSIEILNTSSPGLLTALGFTAGQNDDSRNPLRPPMNRYSHSADAQVSIDVYAQDPNVRREVADLVYSMFSFWLERKFFEFSGRSTYDETIIDEHYHITLGPNVRQNAPQATAPGDDPRDRIHIQRIDVPCFVAMYLDRPVLVPSGPSAGEGWVMDEDDLTQDDTLPTPS